MDLGGHRVKAKSTAPLYTLSRMSPGLSVGMIAVLLAPSESDIDTTSQSTDVLPLEFSTVPRPSGRLLLLGQVPCLAPFRSVLGARLWMRWREPDRDDAQIEIAVEISRDEGSCVARVLARASLPDRWGGWALYRLAGAQGVVDLMLAGSDAPAGSRQEVLHLLVCVDLSRCSEDLGLSPNPFPHRYV